MDIFCGFFLNSFSHVIECNDTDHFVIGINNGFNTLLGPNKPCWRPNNGEWWQLVTPASSYHTGGVNVCMADGSVRFIKDSIAFPTWYALATASGGEALSSDSY